MTPTPFDRIRHTRQISLTVAFAALLLTIAWQWLTVHRNYGGHWSALFCIGANRPQPPQLTAEHLYLFPNSDGYDGQQYHLIAHDLLLHAGFSRYLDEPRLRYRRIFVPATAAILAFGQPNWVDSAYRLVLWLSVLGGAYCLSRLAVRQNRHPVWGLVFLLLPATLVSMDRMVADVTLAALCAAFLLHLDHPRRLWPILAAAALTRETGVLLALSYAAWELYSRQPRRAFIALSALVPALLWFAYIQTQTQPYTYPASYVPGSAIVAGFLHPVDYPAFPRAATAIQDFDRLAVFGTLLAFLLSLARPRNAAYLAALAFSLLGLLLQRPDNWQQVYDYGRVYTPVFLFLLAQYFAQPRILLLLPLFLVLPRLAIQFAPQILGILGLN